MTAPHWTRPAHHPLPHGSRFDGAGHDGASLNRRPKPSTAPAGLFAPAPEVIREKAGKPKRKPSKPRPSRAKDPADLKPRKAAACGTDSGYKKHRVEKTPTCEPCRAAHAEVQKKYRDARPVRKQNVRAECGTETGYSGHRTHKERICDACREAHNEAQRQRRGTRASKAGRPFARRHAVAVCGTASGYKRHRRNGEDACEPCKEAKRADNRYWQTERGKAA